MYLAACLLLSFMGSSAALAHDIHRSVAEAEYNATKKKLEVSLTVFVNDLEVALIRQAEREMSLAKTPTKVVDAEIQRFLAQHFVVVNAAKQTASLEWLGRQIETGTEASSDPQVTLFFEVPLPDGMNNSTLKNSVFVDHFADQLNLVHLRSGTRSTELRFTKTDATKPLEFPK